MDEELMPIERTWRDSMRGHSAGGCVPADALLAIAEKGRRAGGYAAAMAHVATCRGCRDTLKLLMDAEDAKPRFSLAALFGNSLQLRLAVTAAAAVAIGLLAFSFLGGPEGQSADSSERLAQGASGPGLERRSNDQPPPPALAKEPESRSERVAEIARPDSNAVRRKQTRRRFVAKAAPKSNVPNLHEGREEVVAVSAVFESGEVICGEVFPSSVIEGEVITTPVVEGEVVPPPRSGDGGGERLDMDSIR